MDSERRSIMVVMRSGFHRFTRDSRSSNRLLRKIGKLKLWTRSCPEDFVHHIGRGTLVLCYTCWGHKGTV